MRVKTLKQHQNKRVAAIILAAGKGERVGQPKWRLRYQERTFLEIILSQLQASQCVDISCVTAMEMMQEVSAIVDKSNLMAPRSCVVTCNPTPIFGMISSVYYGLQAVPNYAGYLIFPVDHPFVQSKTLRLLIEAFIASSVDNVVMVPRYQSDFGHPLIVSGSIAKILTPDFFHLQLKDFLRQQNYHRQQVVVNDSGVLRNVNYLHDINNY